MAVTNTAQEGLQDLLKMQGDAQDASQNLKKLEQARTQFVARGGDEADFPLPKALATAVGVGWLAGPFGGLLMGTLQGILGKRAEQSLLDEYIKDQGIMVEAKEIFNNHVDRIALTANPADMEQLRGWQTQYDIGMAYMAGSPALRERGADNIAEAMSGVNQMSLTNETQQIAATAYEAQLKRDLSATQYTQFNTALGNFTAESASYINVMRESELALDALSNGTPVDLWEAALLINKALNPTSMVTEAEIDMLGNLGSLWDNADVWLEKARSGESLLPEQRRDMVALLYRLRDTSTKYQLSVEARYADLVVNDLELPKNLHNNFRIVDSVPAATPVEIEGKATPTEDIARAARDAINPYTPEGIKRYRTYGWSKLVLDTFKSKWKANEEESKKQKIFEEEFYKQNDRMPTKKEGGVN